MKNKLLTILMVFLIFSLSFISAQTWSALKRLTWNTGLSRFPVSAIDSSNNIFVAYTDDVPGTRHIFLKRSLNNGSTWTGQRMTWGTWSYSSVDLAVDSNDHLHMIYQGKYFEIVHKKSTNTGNTWSSVHNVTWNTSSTYPDIATGSGNQLYAVWNNSSSGNTEIYFKRSTNSGTTWFGLKRLTWSAGESIKPCIILDSTGYIHVIWADDTPGQWQIFYKRSTDNGATWSSPHRMTWLNQALRPALEKDSSNNLYVLFDTASYIYYKKSTNQGTSWTGSKRITWTNNSHSSNICIDSTDTIHLCWSEYFSPSSRDICYKQSTNGGSSWVSYKRVTYGLQTGTDVPAITFDTNNNIHFAWDSYNSGNFEIYYKNRK